MSDARANFSLKRKDEVKLQGYLSISASAGLQTTIPQGNLCG
jgi:hypothetical protein